MARTSIEKNPRPVIKRRKDDKDDIDLKSDDFESGDFFIPSNEAINASKNMAARRKIEMYWERKKLRDQLGDIDDIDLDF